MISGKAIGGLFEKDQVLVGLEIGCDSGTTTEYLLETYPNLTLYVIDPFTDYVDWNGFYLGRRENLYQHVLQKFAKYGDRFKLYRTISDAIFEEFDDEMFDFIFVDGLHTYEQVLADCKNYYTKVKNGGYMTGHDYSVIKEVGKAVDEFAASINKDVIHTINDVWYWKKDNIANEKKDVTLVTALYDIGRSNWAGFQRSHDYYKSLMISVLSLDSPMVVFVDEKDQEFVKEFRGEKKTQIITLAFEELETNRIWGDRIREVMKSERFLQNQKVPSHPQIKYPEYNILMHEKVQFVKKAIAENYFGTDHYMWIDAGVFHMNNRVDLIGRKFPRHQKFLDDKMHFIFIEDFSDEIVNDLEKFYKGHNVKIIGTTWMGHKDSILKFADSYENLLEESLNSSMMDQDQSFLTVTYLKNKEICNLHKGSWQDALNLWV